MADPVAVAALDAWWERDRVPWPLPPWTDREITQMRAALDAPTVEEALEAVGAVPGSWLSTPEQDAANRALMGALREARADRAYPIDDDDVTASLDPTPSGGLDTWEC